ncbi:MAG: hypothetical protein KC502_09155 [Myxococcales bacterium]|nr:hypothetical protein [Myxococcales bacterium]
MRCATTVVMVVALCVWVPQRGHATELDAKVLSRVAREVAKRVPLEEIAKLALKSTRRSVSVGPAIGLGIGTAVPQGVDVPVSMGLSGTYFSNPMLRVDTLKEVARQVLEDRLRQTLHERITRRLARKAAGGLVGLIKSGGKVARSEAQALAQLTAADYAAIANEVWQTLRTALIDRINNDDTRLPSPKISALVEVVRLPTSDAWRVRGTLAYGISKLAIGPTLAVHIGEPSSLAVGAEAAVHSLWGRGPRPWHVQGFVRYEWYLLSHTAFGHQATVGMRLIIDLL